MLSVPMPPGVHPDWRGAHPESDGVIRAVATDPQATDHLPVRVKRDAPAE
jgi:hypothetical protein